MIHRISPRDIAVLAGGFVQGRFSSMGGAGGIDIHLITDEHGVHGKYEGHDFSLTVYEKINSLEFEFKMKVPVQYAEVQRNHYPGLSRIIGDTTIELQQDTYLAKGNIRKSPQQIKSPNDILNDLWNYIMKEAFSLVQRKAFHTRSRH